MVLFKRKRKKPEEIVIKNRELYVLLEEYKRGVVDYLKDNGIEVRYVTDSISNMTDKMFDISKDSRLVIVETGTGRFLKKNEGEQLKELFEIGCDIGSMKMSVIYRNKDVLDSIGKVGKTGKEKKAGKDNEKHKITYAKYTNIRSIVEVLGSIEDEKYIVENEHVDVEDAEIAEGGRSSDDIEGKEVEKVFEFKGNYEEERLDLNIKELVRDEDGESLKGMQIKFRGIE